MSDLSFPPLFRGDAAPAAADPFAAAVEEAQRGCDPGLIVHNAGGGQLAAALVLAPECALEDAMAMVFAAALGFSDALGALAPPEVAVHMVWPAGLRVNGARCGRLRAAASTADPLAEPDWLVIGLEVPLTLEGDPGANPDVTALHEEGCTDVDPFQLLESWSRHMLVWINEWSGAGMARLHAEWRARAHDMGEEVDLALSGSRHAGVFVGLDERGGMLLRRGDESRLIPLTAMLES